MTLNELIQELCDARDALPRGEDDADEVEVRVATQPNYPLAFELDATTLDSTEPAKRVLWLATGDHPRGRGASPYAPTLAWAGGEVEADPEPELGQEPAP